MKNRDNLPTYFQLGRNSIENAEKVFIPNPQTNKGLIGSNKPGKKMSIPVPAYVLSKADSGERLNLHPSGFKDNRGGDKSPIRKLATMLMSEEKRFKEKYER